MPCNSILLFGCDYRLNDLPREFYPYQTCSWIQQLSETPEYRRSHNSTISIGGRPELTISQTSLCNNMRKTEINHRSNLPVDSKIICGYRTRRSLSISKSP